MSQWQFWIDRGGTFTDIVAKRPDGSLVTHKLLSENPEQYRDAAVAGMRYVLGVPLGKPVPTERIACVKMGTTVATNALLERQGEPTALCITRGFRDALRIAYQNRPQLFDLHIQLPELLYGQVIEIDERLGAHGEVVLPLDAARARMALQSAFDAGFRSLAIVFMHGYRYTAHEAQVAAIARAMGFTQVSASHEVSPLMKLVSRGDTTVVDAYLSPILRRYIDQVACELPGVRLLFMQSNGGLTDALRFQGKDSILSGPAGGIVGMSRTSTLAGFAQVIGFDMGGTSTDVSHYAGAYEREFDTQVAGVRLRAPMMSIHTVAAGGGSILHFDGGRYRVGPDSAGANPGPACYRRGGPLTVTDANVMLGRIQPAFFPTVFGPCADQPLDREVVVQAFCTLRRADRSCQRRPAKTPRKKSPKASLRLPLAIWPMPSAHLGAARPRRDHVYPHDLWRGRGPTRLPGRRCPRYDAGIQSIRLPVSCQPMGWAWQNDPAMREQSTEALLDSAVLSSVQAQLDTLAEDAAGGSRTARRATGSAACGQARPSEIRRDRHSIDRRLGITVRYAHGLYRSVSPALFLPRAPRNLWWSNRCR